MSPPEPALPEPPAWLPVSAADETPPRRPPADLLAEASRRLAASHRVPEVAVRWRFQSPLLRPHSHLLPATADLGDGRTVACWYKVAFVPNSVEGTPDAGWVEQTRNGILRSQRAAEALERDRTDARNGTPDVTSTLVLPTILGAQPDLLRVFMTSVPGHPLGKALNPSPKRLLTLRRTFRRIGAAVRRLETLVDEAPPVESTGARERAVGAFELALRTQGLPAEAAPDIETRLDKLASTLAREESGAWVHGDLSGSNVLLRHGGGIGLVDLDWRARPCGFDLATYGVRLQLERPRIDRLTSTCLDALLAGYGGGIRTRAGFLLERSQRWLRLLGEGVLEPSSAVGRRVVEELRGGRPWMPVGRFA